MKTRELHRLLARAGFQYRDRQHRTWRKGAIVVGTLSDPHQEAQPATVKDVQAAIERSKQDAA